MGLTAQTRLSSKGQMVLPSSIRQARNWGAGTELTVEDTPAGVLIRSNDKARLFPPTRYEDVFGSLKYDGPPVSIEDMDKGIEQMFRERHARD